MLQPIVNRSSGLRRMRLLPEVWELSQDQMTKAESVPTLKAAHCDKVEIQSNHCRYSVMNVRHD
jgi:hypothetical protein